MRRKAQTKSESSVNVLRVFFVPPLRVLREPDCTAKRVTKNTKGRHKEHEASDNSHRQVRDHRLYYEIRLPVESLNSHSLSGKLDNQNLNVPYLTPNIGNRMHTVRTATPADKQNILALYRRVAMGAGGIARSEEEVTSEYIQHCMDHAALTGIQLVVDHPADTNEIIAEMHGYKLEPRVFAHVISELTIAVDPQFHGMGIGKLIFTAFLDQIKTNRPDILRVELVTQESNARALNLYKRVGFVIEGRFEKRIRMYNNKLDADIPMAWFNENFIEEIR